LFKTLIFDLDGTLIDSRQDLAHAVNQALISIGKEKKDLETITKYIGNGLAELIRGSVGEMNSTEIIKATVVFEKYYQDHCVDYTQPYAGVVETLKELKGSFQMGVVTNKPESFSRLILKKLGLDSLFSVVIGGETLPQRKPDPAPVLKAVQDLGGAPETSLMIGDGPQDIQAGVSAGLKTCVVKYGFGFSNKVLSLDPDFQIENFNQLKEILYAFNK